MNRTDHAPGARLSLPPDRTQTHLVDRRRLQWTPSLLASIATFALASIALFGPLGVLLFIAASAALIFRQPLFNLQQIGRFAPLLLFPLLAILSTIWSDAPQRSMRSGLELLLTFIAAIVICRNMRVERLILILFLVYFGISLMLAPLVPGALIAKTPLIAWMGSKNQVGLTGYQLLALALGVVSDRRQPAIARVAAIVAMPYGLLLAYVSQSGGTTSSIVLLLLVFPPLAILGALKPTWRTAVVVLALGLLIVAGVFSADIEAAITDFRVNVLNKDVTLTGRTYLWEFADRLSSARPILGDGYAAFWRQGNIDAEGLWRWGGIPNRMGFNFHNVLVGARVDLGLVGESLLIVSFVAVAAVALIRQVVRPQPALACLISMTLVNYVRSYVEEGLISPFNFLTVIWLATALYSFPSASAKSDSNPLSPRLPFTPPVPRSPNPSPRMRGVGNLRRNSD